MEHLSVGELARTVMVGEQPSTDLAVQILGTKPLNGSPVKQRLKLWDGETELSQAVLDLEGSGLAVPAAYSVVRLQGVKVKRAGDKWAAIVQGYTLLKPGASVGRRLVAGPAVTPPTAAPGAPRPLVTPAKAPPAPFDTPRAAQVKRNLAEVSFGTPESKRVAMAGVATHKVAAVTPFTNKATLKVRVEQMGTSRKLNTRNFSGSVLDCVLTDASGSIKLTAWGREGADDVARMEGELREGGTYMVTGAQVKMVQNTTYNHTGHQYELTWTRFTTVEPVVGEVVQISYKFVPLGEVGGLDVGKVVDLLGWVEDEGRASTFTSKAGREVTKREVVLTDTTGSTSLTLWADKAKEFAAGGRVVAVRGAKVGEFQGARSVQLSFTGGYEAEPAVPGVADLVAWASGKRPATSSTVAAGVEGRLLSLAELQEAVTGSRAEVRAVVVARPTKIQGDAMFYRAHRPPAEGRCRKKVEEEAGGGYTCRCGGRGIPAEHTAVRYMVRLCLADTTTHEWAVMFDADTLFGMTAEELEFAKKRSEEEYQTIVDRLVFVERVWRVVGRIETYQGEARVKVMLQEAREVVWEERREQLWEEVVAMETGLGLSHEEEWGLDLTEVLERMGKA